MWLVGMEEERIEDAMTTKTAGKFSAGNVSRGVEHLQITHVISSTET